MRPSTRRALGCAAIALTLAGCGGSSSGSGGGPTVNVWASSVCGAIQTWVGTVAKQPASLQSPTGAVDATKAKSDLVAYLQSAIDATAAMFASIKSAGAPATDRGGEVGNDLVTALQPIQQAFVDAKSKIDALPVTDAAGFQRQAQNIVNELGATTDSGRKSFDDLQQKYKGSDLEKAFNDEPACNALKST